MQDVFPDTSNIFHLSRGQLRFGDIGGEWIVVPPLTPMAASQTSASLWAVGSAVNPSLYLNTSI